MTFRRRIHLSSIVACSAIAVLGLASQAAVAEWQDELTQQILHDEDCEVSFMSQVVERIVEGRRIIMAKVHCEDKRSFDALRPDDDEAFQFKACEVPNAETC